MAYYTIPRYEGKTEGNRIIWETAGELVYIEPYGRDAIRFRSSKSLHIDEALNWTLEEPASPEGVIIEADDEKACMTNGKIQVTITGDGTVTYRNTGLTEGYTRPLSAGPGNTGSHQAISLR